MSLFRLAHLSDPHLPPPVVALAPQGGLKGRISRLAWKRKAHRHDPAVLTAMVADITAYAPDHWAITGDLTNFSTASEFAAAQAWLAGLAPAADVTVSPGNHDALVGPDAERFAPWAPWLGDGGGAAFPQLRVRSGVALINLCSAVATAPHLATGALGAEQIGRLEQTLAELAGADLFKLLLLHHPPRPGVVDGRKSLIDAGALREVLQRHGVDLILHGHAHEAAMGTLPGPHSPIPVLGAPSASAVAGQRHPAGRWHGVEIEPGKDIRVVARGLGCGGGVEALGSYHLAAPQRG